MPRWQVVVTDPARGDIRAALHRTRDEFGTGQAERYRAAIRAALQRLRAGPSVPGSRPVHPSRPGLRKLHLSGRARHVLIFRQGEGHVLFVVRVLHDAMDVIRHLPPETP